MALPAFRRKSIASPTNRDRLSPTASGMPAGTVGGRGETKTGDEANALVPIASPKAVDVNGVKTMVLGADGDATVAWGEDSKECSDCGVLCGVGQQG